MSWLDKFKSKKPTCFLCGTRLIDDKITEVLYRYGEGQGEIGSVKLCPDCGKDIKGHEEDEAVDDESL